MALKVVYLFQKLSWTVLPLFICGVILLGCISFQPSSTQPPTADIETIDEFFARCPTAKEVAHVNTNLTLYFDYDPTTGTLACETSNGSADLTTLQKRVYQTIYVMHLLHFSRSLPWTEKRLYDWFVNAIDGIHFVKGGLSHCCEPGDTIVIALHEGSTILQTDRWIVSGENTLDEMGAWAIHHYLALWIAQYGDPGFLIAPRDDPSAYPLAALQDAETTRLPRFCKEVYVEPTTTLVP